MKKEYSTTVNFYTDLPDEGELDLLIKDLSPGIKKYNAKMVRAKVASSSNKIPDGDVLWIRSMVGNKLEKPWYIKILKVLEDDTMPGAPYSDMFKESKSILDRNKSKH